MFKGKWPNYKLLKIREIPLQQLHFFFLKSAPTLRLVTLVFISSGQVAAKFIHLLLNK